MEEIFKSKKGDRVRLLIGCTGSVASLKIPALIDLLLAANPDVSRASLVLISMDICLVHTEHSLHFFSLDDIHSSVQIFNDSHEWQMFTKRGDPVLHIELKKWADVLLICPLDANTMAKLANGLADNLLTCVARAWDFKKPVYFAPAMNTFMYEHPVTIAQISTLKGFGYKEIASIEKTLICGDTGIGAMAEVGTISLTILDVVNRVKKGKQMPRCS